MTSRDRARILLLSEVGLQVMTPEYASPEQVQGLHATTLSDVYSLGVGATPVRMRLVRDALEHLDSLAGEAIDDLSLQLELATAYERVGEVQGGTTSANLGDTAGAIESLRKGLRIRERLASSGVEDWQIRRALGLSYYKLGAVLWETGDIRGALENSRKTLDLFQSLESDDHPSLDLRFDLVRAHDQIGMILAEQGDVNGALRSFGDICGSSNRFRLINARAKECAVPFR